MPGDFFWRAPYAVSKFTDPQVRKLLTPWIAERRFDVAVCDFLSSALNFPEQLDNSHGAVPAQCGRPSLAAQGGS